MESFSIYVTQTSGSIGGENNAALFSLLSHSINYHILSNTKQVLGGTFEQYNFCLKLETFDYLFHADFFHVGGFAVEFNYQNLVLLIKPAGLVKDNRGIISITINTGRNKTAAAVVRQSKFFSGNIFIVVFFEVSGLGSIRSISLWENMMWR